ncbi:MAG: hypothetical protein U0521_06445 [Anaerolineae bacterium]
MRHLRVVWLAVVGLAIWGTVVYTSAQQGDTTCPQMIEQALGAIGDNCAGLGRNSACYGFQEVRATFTEATAANFFTVPSDRADLVTLRNIGTTRMDTALQQWGIALLSLQANLPDTLPGQNVVFMLLGDTEIENAVKPEDVFVGGATVDVTTRAAAGLFYRPDPTDNVIGAIPANATLTADARTEDGEWMRIVFDGKPGWITREVLIPQGDLDTLPVMLPTMQSPMQSFYLRTGITGTECTQAPDSLVVQGPHDLAVDINTNGADIRLGSTVALRIVPINPELAALFAALYGDIDQVLFLLELDVIDGKAILDPNTDHEIIVPEGYRTLRCLSENENLGLDGIDNDREVFAACPWLTPERWRDTDYELYDALTGVRLNYTINMPVPATLTPTATNTNTPRPYVPPPPTRTPTSTTTPSATNTPITVPTTAATNTATTTATSTATFTPSATPTWTSTFTPTDTNTWTPTFTATNTNTWTPTFTATFTDTPQPTNTPTPTDTLDPIQFG